VVSVTDPYGHITGFLDRFQIIIIVVVEKSLDLIRISCKINVEHDDKSAIHT
jgi:hypothetical protein